MVHYMLYDAHPAAHCVADVATASRCPPNLPYKSQSRSKAKERCQGQSKAAGSEGLKTVVLRLHSNLPEQIFWQSVQTWVTDETGIWKVFYPGVCTVAAIMPTQGEGTSRQKGERGKIRKGDERTHERL